MRSYRAYNTPARKPVDISCRFQKPKDMSVDVILGFMLAKDLELRNLRMLIKGKQLGLSEEFIAKQLVY